MDCSLSEWGQWICFCEHGNEHLIPQKWEGIF